MAVDTITKRIGGYCLLALCTLGAVHSDQQASTYRWSALGESYAAGPGAGARYDHADPRPNCTRNQGAYPAQLHAHFAFDQPPNELQFLACSGAKTPDVIGQAAALRPDTQLVTLSVGGNDVGFSHVLRACVFPDFKNQKVCVNEQRKSAAAIAGLGPALRRTWDAIFTRLPAGDNKRKVFQTLYGQFFNADEPWCSHRTMDPLLPLGPLLTKDIRRKMNVLSAALNDKIKSEMLAYAQEKRSSGAWSSNRIAFLDTDAHVFAGHRFCEPGVHDFRDDKTAFFNALRRDQRPRRGARPARHDLHEKVIQAYHPKSWAHAAVADGVRQAVVRSNAILAEPGVQPLRMEHLDAWNLKTFHW